MSLSQFHPIIARWFAETLGEPTAAQQKGWPAIRAGRHTLVAAPTGSGKTLAAFLTVLDDLFQEGLRAPLPDEVRVVYVSPLKALSADVHKNLAEPRRGVRRIAAELGVEAPRITAAVRTGDTTQAERAAMLRRPPHILVTTPESLYLLLTSERSREMLRTVRTVIVDEIHAVIGSRRGAHLALSLERLQELAGGQLRRVGLSATQKPIDEVGRFLVGAHGGCAIVDEGHRRAIDLQLELPGSPLEAVMALNPTCDVQTFANWYAVQASARTGAAPPLAFDFSSDARPQRMEIARGDEPIDLSRRRRSSSASTSATSTSSASWDPRIGLRR